MIVRELNLKAQEFNCILIMTKKLIRSRGSAFYYLDSIFFQGDLWTVEQVEREPG